jgi:hypothetical protein
MVIDAVVDDYYTNLFVFPNEGAAYRYCGRGNSCAFAQYDAGINRRTFVATTSNLISGTIVYNLIEPLTTQTGFTYVRMNNICYLINSTTGVLV